jgi:predicted peptidase
MKQLAPRLLLFLLLSLITLLTLAATTPSHAGQSPQQLRSTLKKSIAIDYLLSLPDDYEKKSGEKFPLLLFLHGAGERGHNLDLVKAHGPPKLIAEGKSFPFIVASPQCPEDNWWDADELMHLIENLEKNYRVDPDRIYLTGLSMGGYGTWDLATKYPGKFAAIAPICGGGKAWLAARRLKQLPIWVFHGAKDKAVPFAESKEMVEEPKVLDLGVTLAAECLFFATGDV